MDDTVSSAMEALLDESASASGLSNFGDPWFRNPLAAWTEDLLHPRLNDLGRGFFRHQTVRDLGRRLRVIDVLSSAPEIADVPIPPIVYITGIERSGTTLLHNLARLHGRSKALLRWELMEPVPPPDAATFATDPRIAKVQASVDKRRGTMLERMHWVDADDPEECQWGFIDCTSFLAGAAAACMPVWGTFVSAADFTPVYRNYRRLLQLLLWKNPPPTDGFLVLKAPQTSSHLPEFAQVFPEAQFVIADRDPYRALHSREAMVGGIVDPFLVEPAAASDGALIGDDVGDALDQTANRFANIDKVEQAEPKRVVHVSYPDLIAEPTDTISTIYERIGVAADGDLAEKIDGFLAEQRAGRRVAPPPVLPPSAMDRDTVWDHQGIRAYCQRNGIQPELERLTGAHPPN